MLFVRSAKPSRSLACSEQETFPSIRIFDAVFGIKPRRNIQPKNKTEL